MNCLKFFNEKLLPFCGFYFFTPMPSKHQWPPERAEEERERMEKANSMVLLDMCDMKGWRWHGPQSAQLGSSQVRMCGNQDANSVLPIRCSWHQIDNPWSLKKCLVVFFMLGMVNFGLLDRCCGSFKAPLQPLALGQAAHLMPWSRVVFWLLSGVCPTPRSLF